MKRRVEPTLSLDERVKKHKARRWTKAEIDRTYTEQYVDRLLARASRDT